MTNIWPNIEKGIATVLLAVLASQGAQAAGLMLPASNSLTELQIKEHHVDVVIEDGYSITTIDQTFYNPNTQTLEAIYSFPVPENASVGEFTYWIDGKPVTGEVLKKAQARDIYEQEKAQGRETAVTEKDSYRTFDSRVYPVMPQKTVQIRLVYIQPVQVDLGIGRYVYPLEEGGIDDKKLAFWTYNEAVEENFSFNLRMRSSYPIDEFRLPMHPQTAINHSSSHVWEASFSNSASGSVKEESGANSPSAAKLKLDQDIVVYWRHQAGLPGSIDMVTHKPENSDRGTFMMTVTPGDDLSAIEAGRDWIFVLDLSGSMQGKYQSLVEGVRKGLAKLNAGDRFRIVLFNNQARELTQAYIPVTQTNIDRYIQKLETTTPGGGTNLYAGLQKGYRGLDADRPSAVILVTDGVANIGLTEKKDFLSLLEKYDVRLFTFVMGNSANRPLLEGMAKISNGFAMNISNSDDIVGRLVQTADKLSHEAYRDISIDISGVKVKDLTPAHIGSLYRGQQLTIFGHYWGEGEAKIKITGKVSDRNVDYKTRFNFPERSTINPEIERLWAYASISDIQNRIDYLGADSDSEQAIVDLAVEYGLVTDYTSMLVVREEVFEKYNIERKNAARVDTEHTARAQRYAAPTRDNRADKQQPAFSTPRAQPKQGGKGGGAIDLWAFILLLPLLLIGKEKSNK